MKTYLPKIEEIQPRWLLIDCDGQILGKVAARVATILRGKHKPTFTPHMNTGDHVVVINAEKIAVTGSKMSDKFYFEYSGYKGGMKSKSLKELLASHPERVIEHAVKCMLPKNKLADRIFLKMHVYKGTQHPHSAQKPEAVPVDPRKK
ncbi:MAG: 50S ribosomal protein L13 [Candidatus Wallbacteria bacterium]|nr:50S ribosomal protein L13 [Candidatus Wallbacteria bacterium]MBI4869390.1 50S ribosomal protein L13 [Candidatus Wallbacteria bacterium]